MNLQITCLLEGKRCVYTICMKFYTRFIHTFILCQTILRLQGFLSHFHLKLPKPRDWDLLIVSLRDNRILYPQLWQGLLYKVAVTPLKWNCTVIKTLRILHLMRSEQIWEADSWFGCACSRSQQLIVPWKTVKESEEFQWSVSVP